MAVTHCNVVGRVKQGSCSCGIGERAGPAIILFLIMRESIPASTTIMTHCSQARRKTALRPNEALTGEGKL